MIHIKIYDKGHDETHIYAKCRCPGDKKFAQLGALLMAACQIARDVQTGLDKDAFLRMMGRAWDAQEERRNRNE